MHCVMFVSTLGYLSDGEDDKDSRSAPGNGGGPASSWVLGRRVSVIEMRGKGNRFPWMEQ